MKKLLLLTLACVFCFNMTMQAQTETLEELKAMKADKKAAIGAINSEIADLDKKITGFPGWSIGGVGILGLDLNSNSDWYAINSPNSASNGYGITASAFANKNTDGYFWRNLLTANIKKTTTTLNTSLADDVDGNKVSATVDALDISSLYGKKINDKWAISAEGKYITTILSNFNNPGKLTLSAGATWLPIDNMVVLIHPLAYEFNFPGDFVSIPGAKVGVTYAAEIIPGVSWTSNLSAFIPYGGGDGTLNEFPLADDSTLLDPKFNTGATPLSSLDVNYSQSGLTNWTWINGFSTTIIKGIGVGLNVGLRKDAQIANQWQYQRSQTYDPNIESNNPVQVYYNLGLAYTL